MRTSVVVPTLGLSPWLRPCLEALRRDGGEELEILLVAPEAVASQLPAGLADRAVLLPGRPAFAAANNAGFAGARGDLLGTVNDDAVVEPGWLAALSAALVANPGVAAVQGVNLRMEDPEVVDGWGLEWHQRLEAVQLGTGGPPPPDTPPFEVFGVSATAALYRRSALEAVALAPGVFFEPRLGSYYEDVELAGRLREGGWAALAVPAARVHHAGTATGARMPVARYRWLFGNRHLVVARRLGRRFWGRLPRLVATDLGHLVRALAGGNWALVVGIPLGWLRALRLLPAFAHGGPPQRISPGT
ncbi:MAG TPA: glycosyltransferase [Thermoanaerobaculia bacterium]|nr:glycosyltransferase [Thermoanaerobaculia bacterium]